MREYNEIAGDWDASRKKPLSLLPIFLPLVNPSDVVLDAGCGNARNLVEIAKRAKIVIGVESSTEMLTYAKQNVAAAKLGNVELFEHDISKKSGKLAEASFDKIFCIAVLHHLRTERQSIAAFSEFHRLLKPGGLLFVSVWNKRQRKFEKGPANQFVSFPGKQGLVKRFYHFFEGTELRKLAVREGFSVVELFYEFKGGKHAMEGAANLCLVLAKPNGS